jgi:DnaJ-class molecular chaperone
VARLLLISRHRKFDFGHSVNYDFDDYHTHYDYLHIPLRADSARIEAAYLQMLAHLQYGSTDAGQDLSGLIRRIYAAYEVLSQPQSRQAYDAALAHEAEHADRELKSLLDASPPAKHRVQDVPADLVSAMAQMTA